MTDDVRHFSLCIFFLFLPNLVVLIPLSFFRSIFNQILILDITNITNITISFSGFFFFQISIPTHSIPNTSTIRRELIKKSSSLSISVVHYTSESWFNWAILDGRRCCSTWYTKKKKRKKYVRSEVWVNDERP